jgi:ArsR family transcriptional regulator
MIEVEPNWQKRSRIHKPEYRLGDFEEPPIADSSIDLAIFSQALLITRTVRTKRSRRQSAFYVPEDEWSYWTLLAHNFEQARELYADLWLGFSEVELLHLLEQTGFRENEVQRVSRELTSPYFQTVLATGIKMKRVLKAFLLLFFIARGSYTPSGRSSSAATRKSRPGK